MKSVVRGMGADVNTRSIKASLKMNGSEALISR